MAIVQNAYTGDGTTVLYSLSFPYIDQVDVKVEVNNVLVTNYVFATASSIQFTTAPGAGVAIRIYRETYNDETSATFFPGSSIKASDLNNNFTQTLYVVQEVVSRYISKVGDTMQGILNMGGFKITNLGAPTSGTDATTKTYVDTQDALKVSKAGDTMSGNLAMGNNKVTGLGAPSASADAATKSYVDGYINTTYLGPSATDPTTRPGGSPLQVGDQYFNTSQNILKAWTGTVWVISAAAGNIVRWRKTASAGNTTLSGVDDLGITLSYVVGNEQVYLNGALQTRGVDYTAATGTSITLTPALLAGDVVELHAVQGYVSATVPDGSVGETKLATGAVTSAKIADGTIVNVDVNSAAGILASKLSFTQAGTGAVARTVDSKLKEVVSVKDFGAVGDGVADDAAAIQAAVNTGNSVFLPKGVYKLLSPITLSTVGQRFFGETSQDTYLTGGLNHDLLRIAASHCEVDHIHFRPSGGSNAAPPVFAALRIYAALAHIHDNRFLSSAVNTGCGILLDDVNPATSAIVAGAYVHTISDNRIGASGYDFRYGIYSYNANNGQQATKFQNNQFWGDLAIYVFYGGGNYYVGNLLQSATGTYSVGAGNGIDLQANVIGETITGNYIERYQYGVITRRTTQDYILANIYGNHWDNNTTNIYAVSSPLIAYFDEVSWYDFKNTWQWRYNSQDNLKLVNREGIEVLNINRANYAVEHRVLGHNLQQSLSYTANGQTQTPTASWCEITGAGGHRTGCFLGNGVRNGQHLYLRAHTWSVALLNNPGGTQNIAYASNAASATFGQSGNVGTMHLIWDAGYGSGRWFEISRTLA